MFARVISPFGFKGYDAKQGEILKVTPEDLVKYPTNLVLEVQIEEKKDITPIIKKLKIERNKMFKLNKEQTK